jgi:acetyl esterase/lipase
MTSPATRSRRGPKTCRACRREFITVGNLDGLMDEDIDYARRLIAAGVPTDLHVLADGARAFDSMMPGTAVVQRPGAPSKTGCSPARTPAAEATDRPRDHLGLRLQLRLGC